jgi:molecular chaperone GrpE
VAKKPLAGQPEDAEERQPAGAPPVDGSPEAPADVEPEPEATEQAAERVDEDLDELTKTKRERDEYLELAQRARADFENYRKRAAGEAEQALARGRAGLAAELIPSLDNLERALKAAGVDPTAEDSADDAPSEEVSAHQALARGVALVYRDLVAALKRAGVEAYDPTGEPFDPSWHEALSTRSADGVDPGVVLETLEKGYRLDGQVLRPARVVVSE